MKQKTKITKKRFLLGFIAITFLLAIIRLVFPSIAQDKMKALSQMDGDSIGVVEKVDSAKIKAQSTPSNIKLSRFFKADGSQKKNRIVGVRDYEESFPDSQPQQLDAALRYGSSIPYLVPRAAILLQDIARNFMDSLQTKGVPINKLLVSSVLRTKEDVEELRRYNHNATENSCHLYGTTFDIAYNKYASVTRPVTNDTLKWVLSEVLNDLRSQGRCFIKHEKRQGCFHITVR